jgi:flagellar hook-associated protein 2
MATISNLGVGSNLNLADLYDQLEAAEKGKLTAITSQQTTYNAQLSAYGKLQSSLQSLETATAALAKAGTYNSTTVSSTNTAFSASTNSDATVGTYAVNVKQIAKAQVLTTGAIASNTDQLGETTGATRTLTITQPGTKDPLKVTLSDSDTSLTGIAKAINAANGNVTATVVKANDTDYRLMISSKSTGTSSDMTISVSGDDTLQAAIGYDSTSKTGALSVQTNSQNAKIVVNDVEIERSSNTISDALPGVTFTLKSPSTANENLEVSRTTDASKKAITDWVSAYNSLQSTIASVTKYVKVDKDADSQSNSNGALLGDSTVRSIQSQLRSQFTNVESGAYAIMAQLGITQDPTTGSNGETGLLKVDDAKLTKALSDNPQGVSTYFIGDGKTTGFATQMDKTLTSMLSTSSTSSGVIKNATDGINSTLKTLSKRYDAMSDTIDATMARYKAQFTSLDTLVNKLNNTANYLNQQFSTSSS